MKVKDLLEQLTEFDPDSEVAIYDDDNDRNMHILGLSYKVKF